MTIATEPTTSSSGTGRPERGAAIVVNVLLLVVLMIAAAMAVDLGLALLNHRRAPGAAALV